MASYIKGLSSSFVYQLFCLTDTFEQEESQPGADPFTDTLAAVELAKAEVHSNTPAISIHLKLYPIIPLDQRFPNGGS